MSTMLHFVRVYTVCKGKKRSSDRRIQYFFIFFLEAQWLSGRVLDSRPRGRGFEPHRHHFVVVLEQDTFILA